MDRRPEQGSPSSGGGIYRDSYQQATAIVAALSRRRHFLRTAGRQRCDRAGAWGAYQNGRIPATALRPVPSKPALQLECGAATAFDQLNTAFKAQFGQDIGITDGYRSYDEQVRCRLEKGSLCANPGPSNHGWGKAVDIGGCCGINTGAGAAFDWLTAHAGRYGWTPPHGRNLADPNPNPGTGNTARSRRKEEL